MRCFTQFNDHQSEVKIQISDTEPLSSSCDPYTATLAETRWCDNVVRVNLNREVCRSQATQTRFDVLYQQRNRHSRTEMFV